MLERAWAPSRLPSPRPSSLAWPTWVRSRAPLPRSRWSRHRGRHCLGRAVRCHGLLCEHLDCVPGVLRGHARVPAGIRAHRRQAARKRGGGVAGRRLFLFACSARGCPGSRMDARTVIRFPGQPRVYEMSSFPPSPRDHVIRRGRRKRDHKPRRRVWPNESPYPRSVRHAAALLLCAV